VLNITAQRRERPSEIALLFRLTRIALYVIGAGMVLTLVFGLWLVSKTRFRYGDAWVIVSILLWVLANALGGLGGTRDRRTREAAEALAAQGDVPDPELRARVRDPVSLALSYGGGLMLFAILGLMIWKPGA
jgi:uncharacterized membrane protein